MMRILSSLLLASEKFLLGDTHGSRWVSLTRTYLPLLPLLPLPHRVSDIHQQQRSEMIAPLALALALALALVCGRCAAHPLDAGGGGAAGAGPAMEPALLAKIEGKPNWSEGVKSSVQSGLRSCDATFFEDIGFYATPEKLAEECSIKLTHANALKA